MQIIRKQKSCGSNKGCCITDNGQDRLGFNFTAEVRESLNPYIELGYDSNRLYFLPATEQDGYKISVKQGGSGTGRIGLTLNKNNRILSRFIGNHIVKRGVQGWYIEI